MARFFPTMFVGLKMGVVGEDHRIKMGDAIWLFMWLLGRQTGQLKNGIGIVNYGKPITYGVIKADTGFAIRTMSRWMARLIRYKYVELEFQPNSEFVVRIFNAKKYPAAKQISTDNSQVPSPHLARGGSQTWRGVVAKLGDPTPPKSIRGGPRKRQKAFGFVQPSPNGHQIAFPKESSKESTTVLRASPAIPIGVEKMDEKDTAKQVVPSMAALASKKSIPRADTKTPAQMEAERKRQVDDLKEWCAAHGVKFTAPS